MLRKLALVVGIIAGISSACTDYSLAANQYGFTNVKISALDANGGQVVFQVANQNACHQTWISIDQYFGSDMFRFASSLALYAFQTGTPITFGIQSMISNSTQWGVALRAQNITVGNPQ